MAMAKGISEIVGQACGTGQSEVTVYRALKLLWCAACGVPIGVGVLFTRRRLYGGPGLLLLPQCQKCVPFSLRSAVEQERKTSALLETLLTPPPEPGAGQVPELEAEREMVELRLGPALKRCRQRTRS